MITVQARRTAGTMSGPLQTLAPWQRRASRALWLGFAAVCLVSLVAAGYLGIAYPLVIGGLLVPITLLFALVATRQARRLVAVAVTVTMAQVALGVLLLSGRGQTSYIGDWMVRSRFALPTAVRGVLWLLGTVMPLLVSAWVLKHLKHPPQDAD